VRATRSKKSLDPITATALLLSRAEVGAATDDSPRKGGSHSYYWR
jgi:hypothetical protein